MATENMTVSEESYYMFVNYAAVFGVSLQVTRAMADIIDENDGVTVLVSKEDMNQAIENAMLAFRTAMINIFPTEGLSEELNLVQRGSKTTAL